MLINREGWLYLSNQIKKNIYYNRPIGFTNTLTYKNSEVLPELQETLKFAYIHRPRCVTDRKTEKMCLSQYRKIIVILYNWKLLIGSRRGFLDIKQLKELRIRLADTTPVAITVSDISNFNLRYIRRLIVKSVFLECI